MLRQRNPVGVPAEPVQNPNLQSMTGQPGYLYFTVGYAGNRMAQLPCTVKQVDSADIVIMLTNHAAAPGPESAVILEVAGLRSLLQCFTSVRHTGKDGDVTLRTPARPHVVQRRRFPRVEAYIAAYIHTPNRPSEALAAQVINVSIDGVACVLSEHLELGTQVSLDLFNLGLHPPEVQAVVRRCHASADRLWVVGLQFLGVLPGQELYLGKYMTEYVDQADDE